MLMGALVRYIHTVRSAVEHIVGEMAGSRTLAGSWGVAYE